MATVINQFICIGNRIDLEKFIELWQINKTENIKLIVVDSHYFDKAGHLRLTIHHNFYDFFEIFINGLTKYASHLKISFNCWTFDSDEMNGNAFIMTYRHRNNELKYYPMLSSVRKNLSISKERYIYLPENKELKDFSELINYALTRFFGEALFEFNLNEVDTVKTVVLSCERLDSGYYLMKLSNDKCLLIDFVDFQYKRMTFSLEEAYESLQNLYEQPWRLPSTIELRWMDSHLKMLNQGNFTRSPYWSSEFKGHDGGLTYVFGFGVEPDPRDMRYKVRLVMDLDSKQIKNLDKDLKKKKVKTASTKVKKVPNALGPNEIKVGRKIWSTVNLNLDTFRNGDKIFQANSSEEWVQLFEKRKPAYCYYNFDESNGAIYGKLYNWYAVIDRRGLAPHGWRVADTKDWEQLTRNHGDTYTAGLKLKSISRWSEEGNGTNETGFNALPGGAVKKNGETWRIEQEANFWSSSNYHPLYAQYFYLKAYQDHFIKSITELDEGYSVRCVKE